MRQRTAWTRMIEDYGGAAEDLKHINSSSGHVWPPMDWFPLIY